MWLILLLWGSGINWHVLGLYLKTSHKDEPNGKSKLTYMSIFRYEYGYACRKEFSYFGNSCIGECNIKNELKRERLHYHKHDVNHNMKFPLLIKIIYINSRWAKVSVKATKIRNRKEHICRWGRQIYVNWPNAGFNIPPINPGERICLHIKKFKKSI